MKNNIRLLWAFIFAALSQLTMAEDKIEIRPSVWGTEKWYGGYEVYKNGKMDLEIRPSVWGTREWPGGYETYKGGVKTSDIKASVWGQEKWYGGYEVDTKDKNLKTITEFLRK